MSQATGEERGGTQPAAGETGPASHDLSRFDALIFDMDGVITDTASVHARAWRRVFDEYLQWRRDHDESEFEPFDEVADYRRYVDGKPRLDGARSFLEARGIHAPEGEPGDGIEAGTIQGIGARKNDMFQRELEENGVDVFPDAASLLHACRAARMGAAIVSSSRNCQPVLEAAGLLAEFDQRVDGLTLAELGLPGKPAPDMFLEAADRLGVEPSDAAVFEDAESGVEAGRRGEFGLVVGVARHGQNDALLDHGADIAVSTLDALRLGDGERQPDRPVTQLPDALTQFDDVVERLAGRRPVVFLDYDGTLTPIVPRPEDADLDDVMREAVRALAARCVVAVISGRNLEDVTQRVGVDDLYYAGSHGFDVKGPDGLRFEQPEGAEALPALDEAENALRERVGSVEGAQVERKRFAIAVHYRNAPPDRTGDIENAVEGVRAQVKGLRKRGGKKIFELAPDVDWDKGRAVRWLMDALDLGSDAAPLYIGDDLTDEDAFRVVRDNGVGVVVDGSRRLTAATHRLEDVDAVRAFVERLSEFCAGGNA